MEKDIVTRELLEALNNCKADYGNEDIELPIELQEKYPDWDGDIDTINDEDIEAVFYYNDGDIEGMREYLESVEEHEE